LKITVTSIGGEYLSFTLFDFSVVIGSEFILGSLF
jgi:hypothetical protein